MSGRALSCGRIPGLGQTPDRAPAQATAQAAPKTQPPAPTPAPAQKPASSLNVQGEIRFTAQRWRREGDRIYADGEAEVRYKGLVLFADHVEIDSKTKDVLAVGSVVLHMPSRRGATRRRPHPPAARPAAPPPRPHPAAASLPTSSPPIRSSAPKGWSSTWTRPKAGWSKAFGLIQPTLHLSRPTRSTASPTSTTWTRCPSPPAPSPPRAGGSPAPGPT